MTGTDWRCRLFVYGSLMRGQAQDGLLAGLPVVDAQVTGSLYLLPAGYPALVPSADGRPIRGELVTLPDESRLVVLDLYEGLGQGPYQRERVQVLAGRRQLGAQAYVVSPREARRLRLRRLELDDWRSWNR